jgi:type 1 glutamine amidotransferase
MKLRIAAFFRATILATAALALTATAAEPKKLLVVTVTTGFRHSSIPTAEKVLSKLAKESGAFTVDFVRQPEEKVKRPSNPRGDADDEAKAKFKAEMAKYEATQGEFQARVKEALSKLSAENLKSYDGLIFANTTGDLPVPDPQAIIDWVKDGHAFIGMHSASDTFHGFRPYVEMLGGEFLSHGAQASVDCINEDKKHPACSHLPQTWRVYDEIYILKNFERAKVHGLLTLDKEPNRKTPGKGRLFYTSLGHREDVWDDETPANFKRQNSTEVAQAYQKHILGGIKWALRLEESSAKRRN